MPTKKKKGKSKDARPEPKTGVSRHITNRLLRDLATNPQPTPLVGDDEPWKTARQK
jgi:hypothetical protein